MFLKQLLISVAVTALTAGPAAAQTTAPRKPASETSVTPIVDPAAAGVIPPGVFGNSQFQYVPGIGFVSTGSELPDSESGDSPFGGFLPGFGANYGYYPYWGIPSGPYTVLPYITLRNRPSLPMYWRPGAVPPIWNAAVVANRARAAARRKERSASARTNTSALGPGMGPKRPAVSGTRSRREDETAAGRQIEAVMRKRPITEGEIMLLGAQEAQVRVSMNGQERIAHYPLSSVFFFDGQGRLSTALQQPKEMTPGDKVLVPLPMTDDSVTITAVSPPRIHQSVAGSRQSTGSKKPTKKAAKGPGRVRGKASSK